MNFYIDFDNTLYNTKALTAEMLDSIATYISQTQEIAKDDILLQLKAKFNRENIYNIFTLCEYFEEKYNIENQVLQHTIKQILINGYKYVYEDVPEFLENLKEHNHTLSILTAATGIDNIDYQGLKVYGSGITRYFNNIIITTEPKDELDLVYSNGVFIDDNPDELRNLCNTNARKVIRIKRPGAKYSNQIIRNSSNYDAQKYNIDEYTSLSEIKFNYEKKSEILCK